MISARRQTCGLSRSLFYVNRWLLVLVLYPLFLLLEHIVSGLNSSHLIFKGNELMLSILQLVELLLQGGNQQILLGTFGLFVIGRSRHLLQTLCFKFKFASTQQIKQKLARKKRRGFQCLIFIQMEIFILLILAFMGNSADSAHQEDSVNEIQEKEPNTAFNNFKASMLRPWLPVPTLTKTITLFFVISAIFIGVGIPMIILSHQIVDVSIDYQNSCNGGCTLSFTISQTMQAPVYVYYQLENYYQNHRLYASSISQSQLIGNLQSISSISTICSPIVTNADLYTNVSINNAPLNASEPANPCGIVAYTIFNDTFDFFTSNGTIVPVSNQGIAWPSDVAKYKISNPSLQWLNLTDQRVMNWMRIASLPTFRKVWGRINNDLPAGNYTVKIDNNYNVNQYGATKLLVLSTSNFFGSRNTFLSIAYLVMGGICFLIGMAFLIKKIRKDRKKSKE